MIGTTISHYKILEKLGEGGMGVVYKAEDHALDRTVAIKFLPRVVAANSVEQERFIREAKAAAALNHPNISTVHAIETADDETFIVMEYIAGVELKERVRGAPLSIEGALDIATQIAQGLQAAHAKGIVHRDIKSSNIMLTRDDQVKVMDFGLAKVRGAEQVTQIGTTVGTAAYMSPEQARGDEVDHRTDIWSFGIVLYEMLTGSVPFRSDYEQAMTYSILNEEPRPLHEIRPEVPVELERVVNKSLAKDPAHRYQNADDLLRDLRHLTRSSGDRGTVTKGALPSRRRKRVMYGAIALGVLIAVVLAVELLQTGGSRESHTLAVLPFVNESGDPDAEYLSDGITESLIGHLSPIASLKVMARSTVFRFKGPEVDPRAVGRELNVASVLSGRIDQRRDRLIVGVELIDVASGTQIWGERYNRQMSDVFSIEEQISGTIADKLRLTLGVGERDRLSRRTTENTEAYQLYLKGRYYWNKRSMEGMKTALQYFEQAVARDSAYALAWTGIADCYVVGSGAYLQIPPHEADLKAKQAALKAISIDDNLAEAHTSLASVRTSDWDWQGAEREFQRALELNPGYVTAHQWYGELLYLTGRFDESVAEIKRALEIDPLSLIVNSVLGWSFLAARDAERAIAQSRRTLDMEPDFIDAIDCYAQALMLAGRPDEELFPVLIQRDTLIELVRSAEVPLVRDAYEQNGLRGYWGAKLDILSTRGEGQNIWPISLAECYAQLGEVQKAVDVVEELWKKRDSNLTYLPLWVPLDPIRSDTRFREIIRQMNFPQDVASASQRPQQQ
ncbi:MAG: tetratricopeptide repeat-containing serine/threonine-protein kinase [Ignavibacteria bacterium]|nr:tetratricopeptide repeat-containing serine/threonine-protein kinase [Ignavibacteria bacterium]